MPTPADQQIINYGATANDGQGDPLRTAFIKTEDNFDSIWAAGPVGSNVTILNNTISVINTNGNLILAPNGVGQIQANATILPSISNVRDLGSATRQWNTLYAQYINATQVDVSGDLTVDGNLTVQGNIIQVGNIVTETLTIQLANAAVTANSANGAGITVGASDNIATLLYNSASNVWTTNIGLSATGNVTAPYFIGNGSQLTGISSYSNANVATFMAAFGSNTISTTGNITSNYFFGNGSQLTGISTSSISNGTSNVSIATANGNPTVTSAGNTWTFGGPQPDALYWPNGSFQATAFVGQALDLVNTGNASITSNSTGNTTYVWTFGDDGRLTFPGTPRIDTDANNFEVQAAEAISLEANTVVNIYTDSGNNAFQWQFGDDGNFTIPDAIIGTGNLTLYNYDGADESQLSLSGSGVSLYSNASIDLEANIGSNVSILTDGGNREWVFDTTGTLTTPGDIAVAGDITGTAAANTLILKAQPSTNTSIQLNSIVDSIIRIDANLEIITDSSNTSQSWNFDIAGNLTLPNGGSIIVDGGDGVVGPDGDNMVISWDNEELILRSVGGDVDVEADRDFNIRVNYDGGATDYLTKWVFGQDNEIINITGNSAIITEAGNLNLQGGRNTLSSGNVQITAVDNGVAVNTWLFDNTGTLTAPGNINTTGNITGNYFIGNGSQLTGLSGNIANITANVITFNTSAGVSVDAGQMAWNSADGTLDIGLGYADVVLQVGQETHYVVRNDTGNIIENGTAVYCSGVTAGSGRIEAIPMTGSTDPVKFLGLATQDISNGVNGVVTYFGYVRGLDTRGTANTAISVGDETWAVGDQLYVHPTAPGKLTKVVPEAPNVKICVASIMTRNQNSGIVFVRPTSNLGLVDLSDVQIDTPAVNEFLVYAGNRWENTALDISVDTTPTLGGNLAGAGFSISNIGNIVTTGNVSTDWLNIGNVGNIASLQANVSLQIVANASGSAPYWQFNSDGNLYVPGSINGDNNGPLLIDGNGSGTEGYISLPASNFGGEQIAIVNKFSSGNGIRLETNGGNLFFDNTGNLTVPGNIVMPPGASLVGNGASPAPSISGFSSATFGANVTATGNITGGNIITTGNVSGNTAGYAIGYRDIPQVSFAGDTTIATTDAGKHYYSVLSTGNVLTIANNASQGFQVGAAITVVNQGTGNITIAQGSGVTLYLAGNATSGNRSVATFGMATIMKVDTDTWFINGTGVS